MTETSTCDECAQPATRLRELGARVLLAGFQGPKWLCERCWEALNA